MKDKQLLIFDFDGTIADTAVVSVEIINELGEEFGFRKLSRQEFMELKNKSISELLRLSGVSWMKLPLFVKKARSGFLKRLNEVPPVKGMREALFTLRENGFRMGILTSNTRRGVEGFLGRHDMEWFDFIYAPDSLFGKGKVIRQILKERTLKATRVVMIGDETRDIEAATSSGVSSVAVTWGFNSEDLLNTVNPDRMLRSPEQLVQLFC